MGVQGTWKQKNPLNIELLRKKISISHILTLESSQDHLF